MARRRRYFSPPRSRRTDAKVILVIGIIFAAVAVHHFSARTYTQEQQVRARLFLEQIYRLERAHFEQYGAYLPIDNDRTLDVLKLTGVLYQYRVEVPDSASFIATAWADLNGDGKKDVWTVDQNHPVPIHKERD